MAATANFRERTNARNKNELVFEGVHTSIGYLKMRNDIQGKPISGYIKKNTIPLYPTPVEFHLTEVVHVTNKTSLLKIWDSEGFRDPQDSFSWWSPKINYLDIKEAEERYLEELFPNRSNEEKEAQQSFLSKFTTSPPFLNQYSRYGNFQFTFPLTELMETYKKQNCEGKKPVLRVYETKVFKKEIEYVVLVHSPQVNEKFKAFPLLRRSPLVAFDGHQIIWKAQAICETHELEMKIRGNGVVTECMFSKKYYVWDQVSFAFYIPEGLTFTKRRLKASLSCCILGPKIKLSRGENCFSIADAQKVLASLKDDECEKRENEKEEQISEEFV